jgi:carotenoid cleavage dioxygenase
MTLTRRHFLHGTVATGLLSLLGRDALADDKEPESPFLQGNYGPVKEEVTADDLKVIGKLPAEMDGMFVRTGPNPQFPPRGRYHWFDGDGMLHGVRVRDGKASYRNRYVQTAGWKAEKKAGKALWGGLLDPPDFSAPLLDGLPFKNTANTALVWHHGKLLALWEAGAPHVVGIPGLDTLGRENFGGKLKHPFTAHPKVDPATGELIFFGYTPLAALVYYGVADARGVVVHATTVKVPRPVMMHDCAVSAKHTVLLDLPVTFDPTAAAKGKPVLAYDAGHGARLGVLPRRGKGEEVRWFEVKPCYVFHTLNAYDDGDEVVVLGCRLPKLPDVIAGSSEKADAKTLWADSGVLYRWRLDLKTGKVAEGPVDDAPSDFPRVNEALAGRATRFGYAAEFGGELFGGLLKYDLDRGKSERHAHGRGRTGGEGVFVPRPDGKGEDDGWLVTYVHDGGSGTSEMVVIDARDFAAAPVAQVVLPQRVPYGFHGTWVPGSGIARG